MRTRLCYSSPATLGCERVRDRSRSSGQEPTAACCGVRRLSRSFSFLLVDPSHESEQGHASSFTGPSACPTHVRTNPCALDSGSSPSSASIRTLPLSTFVLQVPHCPCRQNDGMLTPCSSAACNNV